MAAREDLARACLKRVRKTVQLLVGLGQDAEDIAQTALMRVFKGLDGYRNESAFTTWVDRITVNTAKEYFRRKPLLRLLTPDSNRVEATATSMSADPQREVENKILMEHLASALHSIKPKKRTALVLQAAYGYTAAEIAEITGCSLETAKKRLQHGRKELLTCAKKRGELRQFVTEGV